MKEATRRTVEDLLGFCDQAARLVAGGHAAWAADEFRRLAGEAIIHRVGEAVARIQRDDPDVVEWHPEISWRAMKGMRNLVAHEYAAIDHELLWRTLSEDVPREAERLRLLIG